MVSDHQTPAKCESSAREVTRRRSNPRCKRPWRLGTETVSGSSQRGGRMKRSSATCNLLGGIRTSWMGVSTKLNLGHHIVSMGDTLGICLGYNVPKVGDDQQMSTRRQTCISTSFMVWDSNVGICGTWFNMINSYKFTIYLHMKGDARCHTE